MKIVRNITVCGLLVLSSLILYGCGKKADENKPLNEVKAEAEQMSAEKLRLLAMKYKDAIVAKKGDVEKLAAKLNGIPIAEKLGTQAKELAAEIEVLNKSISALRERFQVYYHKLKEKGGDLSGLEI